MVRRRRLRRRRRRRVVTARRGGFGRLRVTSAARHGPRVAYRGSGRYSRSEIARVIPALMPRTVNVRFKLCEAFTITAGTGELTAHTVLAADLVDPLVALGSKQPRGFDQWMLFYENWRMISCSIGIRFKNETPLELVVAIMKDPSGTEFAASVPYTTWCQFPLLRQKFLGPEGDGGNEDRRVKWLSHKVVSRRIFRSAGNDEFQGSATGSPNRRSFFHVLVSRPTDVALGTGVLQCTCNLEMTFIVNLFNRTQMVVS